MIVPPPQPLPHPLTGQLFETPVPPGVGWPEDPAPPGTRVARSAAGVRRLAAAADLAEVEARVSVCSACPRLVRWREESAREKRAAFADQPYWGRPIPGWGDPHPRILVVGLAPAAHGGNRTGRVFTGDPSGDWLFASLHRVGLATRATSQHAGDGQRLVGVRMVARVRCAPPDNKPTPAERDACAPWVQREVGLVLPSVRVVVALGAFGWGGALEALAGAGVEVPRPFPKFGHGVEVEMAGPSGPVTLLGSFHPSPHNTFTGRLTAAMTDELFERAQEIADPPGDGTMAGMTDAGTLHAITVLGHDRPGIIAWTTDRLAALGLNIEDTSMTLLRDHFAMTLVCAGPASDDEIATALAPLAEDGSLTVTVREVPHEEPHAPAASQWVLTVHGGDRPGIVSSVVAEVARVEGNITDLTTRLAGELYLLVAEVSLPEGVDTSALEAAIKSVATDLGVGATLRAVEADEL